MAIGIIFLLRSSSATPTFLDHVKLLQEDYINENVNEFLSKANALSEIPEKQQWTFFNEKFESLNGKNTLFIYQNDSLIYWSNSDASDQAVDTSNISFKKQQNGYYVIKQVRLGEYLLKYYICIKKNYYQNNSYLKSEFIPHFDGENFIAINKDSIEGVPIFWENNELYKISLSVNIPNVSLLNRVKIGAYFFLSAYFVLSFLILRIFLKKKDRNFGLAFFKIFTTLFSLRIVLFAFKDLLGIGSIELFDPSIFAVSSWIPSLGDLILHLFTISLIITFASVYASGKRTVYIAQLGIRRKAGKLIIPLFVLFIASLWISWYVTYNLIINSNIPFDTTVLLDLGTYGYIIFVIIILLVLINSSLLFFLIKAIRVSELFSFIVWLMLLITLIAALLLLFKVSEQGLIVGLGYFLSFLILSKGNVFKHIRLLLFSLLVMNASLLSFLVIEAVHKKMLDNAKLNAERIHSPNDPLAAYLLNAAFENASSDLYIKRQFYNSSTTQGLENWIKLQYLRGYLDRYAILDIKKEYGYDPVGDLEKVEVTNASVTDSKPINYIYPERIRGKQAYTLFLPINSDTYLPDTLRVSLIQKTIKAASPFPTLFTQGETSKGNSGANYNWAYYENGRLASQNGTFPYTLVDVIWQPDSLEFTVQNKDGFSHLLFKPDQHDLIVVSFPNKGIIEYFTVASLFLMFSVLMLGFIWIVVQANQLSNLVKNMNYKNTIELTLIGSITLVMLLLGYITITYTVFKTKTKQQNILEDKIQSILSNIDVLLKHQNQSQFTDNEIQKLNALSASYFTDIFIYNKKGNIIFASQEKLFEQGLLSNLINKDAFFQMVMLQRTLFVAEEHVGNLKYLSAYVPIKNAKNELVAILNVPSFSNEKEFRSDINAFLGSLINIYVVAIIIIVLLVFWISDRITVPLKRITNIISNTRLGDQERASAVSAPETNEIGILLREYNKMLQTLEENAKMIALNEREAAWRDMARQIAHEIRNPLTPIKLNIQHLLRAWNDKSDRFDIIINRISNTIQEQIDSLNRIAVEFSLFAQMPIGEKKMIDLKEIIQSNVDLFKQSATIVFDDEKSDKKIIEFDHEQLDRVFQNLIKNGIQSVQNDKVPKIYIHVEDEKEAYLVSVKDNGSGITPETSSKIFTPNFTTKSSGMGLGLPIVKKILETHKADIWFDSVLGEGTVFYIRIPKP